MPFYKADNVTHQEIFISSSFYSRDIDDYLDINGARLQHQIAYGELQKKISKPEVLSTEIFKVSESWSRDLYETSISLLHNG